MATQKKKFNAVVVDDEAKRNDTYLKVLGEKYNVKIINDFSEIKRNEIMKNDILIIDVWFGGVTAFRIIKEYALTLPIVLVSGKWTEQGEPSDIILSVPDYKNIIKVISWNSFNKKGSNVQIGEEIFYQFCKFKNLFISHNEEKFSILHLSDLQFGGKTAAGSFNDYFRIAQFLKEKEIKPEIIVITGDIADKGKEAEYKENTYINQKIGFYNYIHFAHNFSGDLSYFSYMDKAIHINDTFKDWGVRFITLNSVYNINSDNCENNFGKFYCDLSAMDQNELSSGVNVNDELCNILISHNPPENFRLGTENGERSWGRMQTIIQDNKINIIMSGHTHDFKPASRLRDGGGNYCNKAICISAPSARLNAASRTEDAYRGFNIIEFYREDGSIKKVIPRYFSMQKASVKEVTDYMEEYTV